MKTLILTEKPSVARYIAKVLKCTKQNNGYIEGNNYYITWALGHLVTLAMPEEIDPKWSKWDLSDLPILPEKFKTKVIGNTSKQFRTVKSLLEKSDVNELIVATDAGREGELVARLILHKSSFKGTKKRLWISSMTDKAIIDGFKNLKPLANYDRLYDSAYARMIADWLVGLNATRALTCKNNASLSAGRVQTPTLSMIIKREEEIRNFRPITYYKIVAQDGAVCFNDNAKKQYYNIEEAEQVIKSLKTQQLKVESITKKVIKKKPANLYNLSSLQQDANKLYSFSPKRTLDLIQSLYEKHSCLTYPRTDSKYLTSDMYSTIKDRMISLTKTSFKEYANMILKNEIKKSGHVFNDKLVSDHHAIIPTEVAPSMYDLSDAELKIYNLVAKRFLSCFLNDCEEEEQKVKLTSGNYSFEKTFTSIITPGFEILNNVVSTTKKISYQQNQILTNVTYKTEKNQTTPPSKFTEATLLDAMENPSKYIDNKGVKLLSGIGTPATRAEIIERIFTAGYAKLDGRVISKTSKGEQLLKFVPDKLSKVELTAEIEAKLEKIEKGELRVEEFLKDITKFTNEVVCAIKEQKVNYVHDNITSKKCPLCDSRLLKEDLKQITRYKCSNLECNYKKVIERVSNARCPNCHKKLTIIGDEKKFYVCKCNFKIDYDKFNSQLNEKKKDLSTKQVRNILKKQEEPTFNPFLDAFKDIK